MGHFRAEMPRRIIKGWRNATVIICRKHFNRRGPYFGYKRDEQKLRQNLNLRLQIQAAVLWHAALQLQCCCAAVLPCCRAAVMKCCRAAMLQCCRAAVRPCGRAAVLPYYHAACCRAAVAPCTHAPMQSCGGKRRCMSHACRAAGSSASIRGNSSSPKSAKPVWPARLASQSGHPSSQPDQDCPLVQAAAAGLAPFGRRGPLGPASDSRESPSESRQGPTRIRAPAKMPAGGASGASQGRAWMGQAQGAPAVPGARRLRLCRCSQRRRRTAKHPPRPRTTRDVEKGSKRTGSK
jgi:hypothetical protein